MFNLEEGGVLEDDLIEQINKGEYGASESDRNTVLAYFFAKCKWEYYVFLVQVLLHLSWRLMLMDEKELLKGQASTVNLVQQENYSEGKSLALSSMSVQNVRSKY